MGMTSEQREVLAYIVVDPDAWFSHVEREFGEYAEIILEDKVAKWKPFYVAAKARDGDLYRSRAERIADDPLGV